MSTHSKRYRANRSKIELGKRYTLQQAMGLVQELAPAKFAESVDLHLLLNVDPKKAEQAVRGTVVLPHGTGKTQRVLVFATGADAEAATAAGADVVGYEDLVKKVQDGWTDFDIAIATPTTMREVGKLGKVLGPRGLMPSPKAGTVATDVANAVKEFKAGKVEFRVDKQAGIHCAIGKVAFGAEKLLENARAFIAAVQKARPTTVKGAYMLKIAVSSTMSPGVRIDPRDVDREAAE
jgi:large subunit ribosomal protein L1